MSWMVSLKSCRIRSLTFAAFSGVMPVDGWFDWSLSSFDVWPFLKHLCQSLSLCLAWTVVTKSLLQLLVCFCSGFPKFKTKLCTDTLLSEASHPKTANSRKHNNGNMSTNNKPNHSNWCRLPHSFKQGVWGRHVSIFQCTHNHSRAKFKFLELFG
jgi:hypothetical protein